MSKPLTFVCNKPAPAILGANCALPTGHVGPCHYLSGQEWLAAVRAEVERIQRHLDQKPVPRHIVRDCPHNMGDPALSMLGHMLQQAFSATGATEEDAPKPLLQPGDVWTIKIEDDHHCIHVNGELKRGDQVLASLLRVTLDLSEICPCEEMRKQKEREWQEWEAQQKGRNHLRDYLEKAYSALGTPEAAAGICGMGASNGVKSNRVPHYIPEEASPDAF